MHSALILAPFLFSLSSGLSLSALKKAAAAPSSSVSPLRGFFNNAFATETATLRDDKVLDFVKQARAAGPVGMDIPEEERQALVSVAKDDIASLSDKKPARVPLSGLHKLVYSASPGGSSGKIGPFVGKVTQEFVDDVTFINAVSLGPLKIALRAEREVKSDTAIKVTFRETTITLFGNKLTSKMIENSGGVWKYVFSGVVKDPNGRQKLVRVMETPSLFVLEQDL